MSRSWKRRKAATSPRKLAKAVVNYRRGTEARNCGNCAMFHPTDGSCDLVLGHIRPTDVCDKWVKDRK